MSEREIELVCMTITSIGIIALIAWMAYIDKR